MMGCPFGTHRVLDPAGLLPQPAWKLDNSIDKICDNEILIDVEAIFNPKGYGGHKGLESYHRISAFNLGAQVPGEVLINKAVEAGADAILVSQVVTQKDIHLQNLTNP